MPISPEAAWRRLEARLEPLTPERLPRSRALDRVLAEALDATVDVPAADVSAMDGYAVGRLVAADDRLPVTATVAAGDAPGRELAPDAAMRIMTGAPVPGGTVAVVPVEETDGGAGEVRFARPAEAGRHIRRQGEIQRRGDPLLAAGHRLTAGALSLLATHGHREVTVHRAPRVRIVVTGDEVVPPDTEPAPGQLRDSHTDFLVAAGRTLGLEFEPLGIAPDEPRALALRVRKGLESDLLLISGGVSMGEFDFVEDALAEAGCETLFDAVGIQPGKPLVAGRTDRGWVFGLPGNPGSVMVCFWLFVRPLLRRLMGHDDGFWHGAIGGRLAAPLPAAKGRDRFLPALVASSGGLPEVTPAPPRGSHDLSAFACGTGLVRVRARAAAAAVGEPCEWLPLTAP